MPKLMLAKPSFFCIVLREWCGFRRRELTPKKRTVLMRGWKFDKVLIFITLGCFIPESWRRQMLSQIRCCCHFYSFLLLLQISFIRRRDFHILTNGHTVYTNDQRFEIFHAAKSHDWYLVIKKANHNDSGIYDCQVEGPTKKQNAMKAICQDQS